MPSSSLIGLREFRPSTRLLDAAMAEVWPLISTKAGMGRWWIAPSPSLTCEMAGSSAITGRTARVDRQRLTDLKEPAGRCMRREHEV